MWQRCCVDLFEQFVMRGLSVLTRSAHWVSDSANVPRPAGSSFILLRQIPDARCSTLLGAWQCLKYPWELRRLV